MFTWKGKYANTFYAVFVTETVLGIQVLQHPLSYNGQFDLGLPHSSSSPKQRCKQYTQVWVVTVQRLLGEEQGEQKIYT